MKYVPIQRGVRKTYSRYNNMPACPFAKRAWVDDV